MLLQYHDYLLEQSIDNKFFVGLDNYKFINKNLLQKGLHYPDIPCSTLIISNNNIKYLNYKTCKIPLQLIYLFDENNYGLEEIVQSHRGRQAIGHSMTFDPNISMIELRQKILRRLEISYMLALQDNSLIKKCNSKDCDVCYNTWLNKYECIDSEPNIFWIGQILHCIQDSYSRAHTVRLFDTKNYAPSINIIKYKNKTKKEKQLLTFRLVKKINSIIDKINLSTLKIPENIIEFLKKYIKDKKLLKILENNPNDISHIFKIILFFKFQEKYISDLYNGRDNLPSELNLNNNTYPYKKYPYIVSFRYIDHQQKCGMFFHAKYDIQKTNKIFEKYIIKNCKDVLKMYKKHILDKKKSLQNKIKEMVTYLASNVFPIPEEFHMKSSASVSDCIM